MTRNKLYSSVQISGKKGFTLIELLVVITIIAILCTLLVVVINQVRYQARTTVCAIQLRQWGASLLAFAADNRGWFPRQLIPTSVGKNTPNLSAAMYDSLCDNYGLPPRIYACPLFINQKNMDAVVVEMNLYRATNGIVNIGYSYWIQRSDSDFPFPPLAVAAPSRTSGSNNMDVPLMSDFAGRPNGGSGDLFSYHMRSGDYPTNQVFIDGRVSAARRSQLLFRYSGNWENWH